MKPSSRRRAVRLALAALSFALFVMALPAQAATYNLFESGQVRPLALSFDGKHLFAINTPDNRLEILRVQNSGLSYEGSVTVGLEPVAVAQRTDDEVWVVNHLSDSVSVINVSDPMHPRVERTLLVGDEPRDIVFGGLNKSRAFITTAHRGQNVPYDPQLTTPGIGRADVWVFNADQLGTSSLGGTPLTIITLFSDTPRGLAVSPDGTRVYAAGFHSGNKTTVLHRTAIATGAGLPPPTTDHLGTPQPKAALIVKHNGSHWVDTLGRTWDDKVKLSLPDKDVFVINATSNPPAQLAGTAGYYTGVGTILFNMIVNPANGKVYVTNTDANNLNRFEGPGTFAGSSVRGHLHESRITVLGPASVKPRHLNKHINYKACCAPTPNAVNDKSLATPVGMAINSSGSTLYVAALGSSKIGVYGTSALENNTFVPSTANQIVLDNNGKPVGPTGLALDEARGRLYVATRFDNAIAVVNTSTKQVIQRTPLYNPEPPSVVHGRSFLYDARLSSSNGEASCASCHVFGDFDSLAWDLGNPDTTTVTNPGPVAVDLMFGVETVNDFSALKGPMTTQSLRGMANHGPMHWRGDRTGGNDDPSAQPNEGSFDEHTAFKKFQEAFGDLLGRNGPIPAAAMDAFANFSLQIMYPPNPIRSLDNSLNTDQQAGRDHFFSLGTCVENACQTCHRTDPDANAEFGEPFPGFFGSDGRSTLGEVAQGMKIPHFRNAYQKVGMFGMTALPQHFFPGDNEHKGDQVRGFGYFNDGAHDTIFRFTTSFGFDKASGSPNGFDDSPGGGGALRRRQVEQFLLAFDSNLAPIVGQQVTLTQQNYAAAIGRVKLLLERAEEGECDVVAKSTILDEEFGFFYLGNGHFITSRQGLGVLPKAVLFSLPYALNQSVTFTCVPPGAGERIGIDRDEDGIRDGDE